MFQKLENHSQSQLLSQNLKKIQSQANFDTFMTDFESKLTLTDSKTIRDMLWPFQIDKYLPS